MQLGSRAGCATALLSTEKPNDAKDVSPRSRCAEVGDDLAAPVPGSASQHGSRLRQGIPYLECAVHARMRGPHRPAEGYSEIPQAAAALVDAKAAVLLLRLLQLAASATRRDPDRRHYAGLFLPRLQYLEIHSGRVCGTSRRLQGRFPDA